MHACPGARRGKRPRPDPGVFEHRRWRAPHKRAQYRAAPPAAQPLPCRPAMPGRCPAAAPPRAPRCGWRSMWAGGGRPESCSPPTPRTPTAASPSAWEITPEGERLLEAVGELRPPPSPRLGRLLRRGARTASLGWIAQSSPPVPSGGTSVREGAAGPGDTFSLASCTTNCPLLRAGGYEGARFGLPVDRECRL